MVRKESVSHEDRQKFRDKIERLKQESTDKGLITEAVEEFASQHVISRSTAWNIIGEDTTRPDYWETVLHQKMLSFKTKEQQRIALAGTDE